MTRNAGSCFLAPLSKWVIAVAVITSIGVGLPLPVRADDGGTCEPLPPPTGVVVTVTTEAELWDAVNTAVPGTTILLADGTYNLAQHGHYVWIVTPNITLRSASGNREAVVLDDNYGGSEIVTILASNVTVADLTIKRAGTHPIHVVSSDGGDTLNTLIYNVHIVDPGEQAIKINPHTARVYFPDYGEVACSRIEMTDAGRTHVSNCYTGGVDGHQARGWVIRDNVIEGFWCPSDLSEHAVHFWTGSRDTVVERNVLTNNARGVGFGLLQSGAGRTYGDNPCPEAGGGYVGHYGGVIRNNFVFVNRAELFASEYGFDCGICLWQACHTAAVHNTVFSTSDPFSSIEWRFDNTYVEIMNNLVSHNLMDRGGHATLAGNLEDASSSRFVAGSNGDLHLVATAADAIDQGVSVAAGLCDDDIDGDARPIGSARDIGADEYGAPPPSAVTDPRVTQAMAGSGVLTVTLRWTAPTNAVTYTLRYSNTAMSEANWDGAADVSVPFTAAPGAVEWLTPTVAYAGGAAYFALKSQNVDGAWSNLSNNAFWPHVDVYLPIVMRNR